MLTDSLQRGLREREEHAADRRQLSILFPSFADAPFSDLSPFLLHPASPIWNRCYLFPRVRYLPVPSLHPSITHTHIYIYLLFATRERYSTESPEISNPFRDEKRRSVRLCAVYARFALPLLPKDSIKISAAWSRTTRGL